MATRQDRVHVTLFVPGTQEDVRAWGRALDAKGFTLDGDTLRGAGLPFPVKLEWIENDGSFGQAFSFGTAPAEQQRAIDGAPGALLIYLPADLHRERAPIATLVRALASCGALAVRVEESRLGYPVDRWLELVEGTDPWSLYRAVVVMLGNERGATTCGMHAFSLPDAHVAFDDGTDEVTANALLGALNVYQVAEDPVLVSGHTFAPDADTPRRVLRRWPDATYPPGHGCHNPFGVWRLGPAGSASEPARKLAVVPIPALVALLTATEAKAGRPLTREEIEEIASKCTCIAMEHRDARELDRSRGYADLDPARAWEQWQIARKSG
jgi:hypothetical protein